MQPVAETPLWLRSQVNRGSGRVRWQEPEAAAMTTHSVGDGGGSTHGMVWRPSVFQRDRAFHLHQHRELCELYAIDAAARAQLTISTVPPHPRRARDEKAVLRLLQWNINNLMGHAGEVHWPDAREAAEYVVSFDADVLVLQEAGVSGWDLARIIDILHGDAMQPGLAGGVSLEDRVAELMPLFKEPLDGRTTRLSRSMCNFILRLYLAGYTVLQGSPVSYPTLLASRLPLVADGDRPVAVQGGFALNRHRSDDESRGGCMIRVDAGGFGEVCVYGTHFSHYIDATDPDRRQRQAFAVIDRIREDTMADGHHGACPVLVAADFNQQRLPDYPAEERHAIRLSMEQRDQPEDDGACKALNDAGLVCCYDMSAARHNWEGVYPPPTHWTSTIVDYAYGRDAEACGVYVGYSSLSDHQPVVTDWVTA